MSTPERWTVGFRSAKYTDDPHEVYPVVSVPGGDWRPGTDHEYVRSGEQEEDARLMASAPDLLDALQGLVAAFDADLHDLMLAKLAAKAAITQATGGAK